jgi:hypothetical protein
MYGELGYAVAYVHLFCVLSCVERYVDCFPCRLEGRITKFAIREDSNFS